MSTSCGNPPSATPPTPIAQRHADGTWQLSPAVHRITDDSRTVGPGDLFVAVRGARDDGHAYLREVADAGAVAAVVDAPDVLAAAPPDLPLVVVPNSREALGELASTVYGHPSRQLRMIGVTGTNGKTTVAVMLAAILAAAGRPAQSLGTLGPFDDERGYPLTTPFPLQLQRILRRLADEGTQYVVMEVSSHGIAQRRVAGIEFDVAVLTSLGRDHLDYHPTLKAYWAVKTRLFKMLSRPRHKAFEPVAVLPLEGEGIEAVARHVRVKSLRFGMRDAADVHAVATEPLTWGTRLALSVGGTEVTTRIHLPGRFNVENALAAAAAAHVLGVAPDRIAAGLDSVRRVPGRGERITLPGGGFAVVDYAHNPDGLARLLYAVREGAPARRLVCVFGGRGHRDPGKLPLMGEAASRFADALVLTTDSPLDEDPRRLAAAIEAGVAEGSAMAVEYVEDRGKAIARALRLAGPGGVVVITGRGHEKEQWIGDRVLRRPDADLVREAVRNAAEADAPGSDGRPARPQRRRNPRREPRRL